jgi:hypothetical protein
MTAEVSVERQFRFQCSCGITMVSGERTVICTGCGAYLGIRKARRHLQRADSVAYYGSRTLPVHRVERRRAESRRDNRNAPAEISNKTFSSRVRAWLKSALARSVPMQAQQTDEVPHRQAQGAMQLKTPEQLRGLPAVSESPRGPWFEGAHVKVGPTRPDGRPHPHAGKTGRVTRFADAYSDPYWLGRPSAMVKLDSGTWPRRFVWVSLQCLEALHEDPPTRNS